MTSTRGGGGSSIRSSGGGSQVGGGGSPIQRASDSVALVRASGGVLEVPRRQHFQGRRASDVRVATTTHEARCSSERRHGRPEMRAAMIARDIFRSDVVFFSIIVFMPTTCIIYAKNYTILCLNTEFVYQFTACTLERQFLDL
jgi:hypothetical protein